MVSIFEILYIEAVIGIKKTQQNFATIIIINNFLPILSRVLPGLQGVCELQNTPNVMPDERTQCSVAKVPYSGDTFELAPPQALSSDLNVGLGAIFNALSSLVTSSVAILHPPTHTQSVRDSERALASEVE